MLRTPAEVLYAEEIEALTNNDRHDRPPGWKMSPRAVLSYICGGKCGSLDVTPKYIGNQRLVEIAISTLVTDRALLLIGEPGHGQVVALGAPHRRDQWRLDQGRARNGRNDRGADSLYLELCVADRPRAKSWGPDQESRSFAQWSRAAWPDLRK